MSTARHHTDWLSVVEASGPFLSIPVLTRVFPQGLEAHDPEHYRDLKLAFGQWQETLDGRATDPIHHEWIRYVLEETLGFSDEVLRQGQSIPPGLEAHIAEHGETLRPDLVLVNPDGASDAGKPRLLIRTLPPKTGLERALAGKRWKAFPATRMMELLRASGVPLGLVTNGEQWMLVHAPVGETSSFVSWHASLWFEEQVTLRAFRSLLGVARFFVAPENTLEALFKESADNQHEVTEQLGYQVRRAVEVLVQEIDRIDKDRGRALLAGVDEKRLYDAALTVMMRLVFLFSAEERELLLLGDPVYDQHYAVSTLRGILREDADQYGEEILERRFDAWCRLLAAFRLVYSGIFHDRLRSPPYNGSLFDPDRYPFLEGRPLGSSWHDTPSDPLPINNRAVLHLLEALQILQVRLPRGGPAEARRLSFRALDIEQIGHVYEGLLDHTAVRAEEPVLGLIGPRDHEEEIPISELEDHLSRGVDDLAEYLKKRTKRSKKTLLKAIESPTISDESRLRVACDNDEELIRRVRPFAGLIREDTSGYPVVFPPGSVYVTQGTDRRTTGTHYTPRSLTEPVVKYTLEPLVYEGPAEGKPREEWKLKSAKEILDLKVCDMAMGSGAFLVQACRFLSERLVEAWEEAEAASDGKILVAPDGRPSTGVPEEQLLPKDIEERLVLARRIIADRCLYGVDKDPMAVEMAKLSIWLVTMAKGKPFTFLDHCFKCGDSLLGVDVEQLQTWSLDRSGKKGLDIFVTAELDEAIALRSSLEGLVEDDIQTVELKARLHDQAEKKLERLRLAGDLIIGPSFVEGSESEREELRANLQARFVTFKSFDSEADIEDLRSQAEDMLDVRPTFHWPFEFPEVFLEGERGGFDAIIGNPPFQGGQRITGALGTDYREYLVNYLANGMRGSADLCAYFFLRANQLLRPGGVFGMLATNTIAQGDTREVGLEQIASIGNSIIRALPSTKWPGSANLEIAIIWMTTGEWNAKCTLSNTETSVITSYLTVPSKAHGTPFKLNSNKGLAFQGSVVLGKGFILANDEAFELIQRDPSNADVILPFLIGDDVNSRYDQSASRCAINFYDWPLNRSAKGKWLQSNEVQQKSYLHDGIVPSDYPFSVAADYPLCYEIIAKSVKQERLKLKGRNPIGDKRAKYWWRYGADAKTLYFRIQGMKSVIVCSEVTKHLGFSEVPTGQVFSDRVDVFVVQCARYFPLLQSTMHEIWARYYCSHLETRLKYSTGNAFETYPFPAFLTGLENVGVEYLNQRTVIMHERKEGLTKTYNGFHNPAETSDEIAKLRRLHIEMDQAVAEAYGWTDLDLGHGFHETKQGLRYTICEEARREVLDRLLELNHERYEEEVKQGLHEKGRKKGTAKKRGRRKAVTGNLPGLA